MTDISSIRAFNAGLGSAPGYIALPAVPSVQMMLAAANSRDVYRPGDRLGDYIVAWNHEPHEAPPSIPDVLVSEYGKQRAFELCVLADAWHGCFDGFSEWRRRRGREGTTNFVTGWLKALPIVCPPGGWPETKEECTDEHEEHARCVETESAAPMQHGWAEIERAGAISAPARCVGIMALRARQKESATLLFSSVEELVDTDRLPYVPRYTKDHHFDDEERASILISAMWNAASVSVLGTGAHTPMPSDIHAHAARMVEELTKRTKFRRLWENFYIEAPYSSIRIAGPQGHFQATVGQNGIDWEAEAFEDGTAWKRRGADLRIEREADMLGAAIAALDRHEATEFACESVRLRWD